VILIGCVLWLVVVGYCIFFVQWMIGGDIDVITGILGIGLFMGLGITVFSPPVPIMGTVSAIAIGGSGIMLPILRGVMRHRDKRDAEVEAIKIAYEGFVFRPNNPSAKIKLARHLWNLGVLGHAYALAEAAIPSLPRQFFPDEHRMFATWQMRPPSQSMFSPITCVECGHANVPGNVHCAGCGSRFLLLVVQRKALGSKLGRRLLAAWLTMMVMLLGIPFAASTGGTVAVIVVVAMVVLAIGSLVLALQPLKGKA
jgi:hypothetical protein